MDTLLCRCGYTREDARCGAWHRPEASCHGPATLAALAAHEAAVAARRAAEEREADGLATTDDVDAAIVAEDAAERAVSSAIEEEIAEAQRHHDTHCGE